MHHSSACESFHKQYRPTLISLRQIKTLNTSNHRGVKVAQGLRRSWLLLGLAAGWLVASGCGDPEIQSYRVPKETSPAPAATAAANRLPHLHWDLPKGWVELPPDRLRMASFRVTGENGTKAEVAIIPLPGLTNSIELESVNLWREELQLSALPPENLTNQASAITFGGLPARLYDMSSSTNRAGESFRRRTLGVILEREGVLWFAKMTGDEPVVALEAPRLRTFLESVTFDESDHSLPAAPATATRPATSGPGLPNWTVPGHWQSKSPGPMVLVAYIVPGDAGKQADVTISKLAGEGGTLLGNVNRWRGQLGLPPTTEAELPKQLSFIEVGGASAPRVELAGTNPRTSREEKMVAVAVRRGDETWFYKLMGEPSVVEAEKDTFAKFIQSAY